MLSVVVVNKTDFPHTIIKFVEGWRSYLKAFRLGKKYLTKCKSIKIHDNLVWHFDTTFSLWPTKMSWVIENECKTEQVFVSEKWELKCKYAINATSGKFRSVKKERFVLEWTEATPPAWTLQLHCWVCETSLLCCLFDRRKVLLRLNYYKNIVRCIFFGEL